MLQYHKAGLFKKHLQTYVTFSFSFFFSSFDIMILCCSEAVGLGTLRQTYQCIIWHVGLYLPFFITSLCERQQHSEY